jgi:hypothetical protein
LCVRRKEFPAEDRGHSQTVSTSELLRLKHGTAHSKRAVQSPRAEFRTIASIRLFREDAIMKRYRWLARAAAALVALEALVFAAAPSPAHATTPALCEVRLKIVAVPDETDPHHAGLLNSLLSAHPGYRLILQSPEVDNDAVVVDLAGPGPQANCRAVIEAIRGDARVSSVELQGDPAIEPRLAPDGDLVVYPKKGGSYAQRSSDRYQCDIWAADATGYDPTKSHGGVRLDAEPARRAEYLRAEAACFEARGYTVR